MAMFWFSKESIVHGQVFACTNKSEHECFERLIFGTNRLYAPAAMRVRKGDFLFLLNIDSDIIHGVFKAASKAEMNIQPDAWNGKYPYQVKAKPVGKIMPLENARKLLKTLGIKRSSPIKREAIIKLLELYRPKDLQMNAWFQFLSETENTDLEIAEEPKSWELLPEAKVIKKTALESDEELPLLEATTLWDFPRQSYGKHPKGDNKYPGVTPALLIWNLVWRYTEPGDLVVDPMCGSGTTIDVCKEEGRRVIGYDIAPTRPDIIQSRELR
jgi:hypothetical protein